MITEKNYKGLFEALPNLISHYSGIRFLVIWSLAQSVESKAVVLDEYAEFIATCFEDIYRHTENVKHIRGKYYELLKVLCIRYPSVAGIYRQNEQISRRIVQGII